MSHICDIMLTLHCGERDGYPKSQKCLDQLNAYLVKDFGQPLKRVDDYRDSDTPGKAMQCEVYIGAHNGLDLENFVEFFRTLHWVFAPECVQLFLKDEHDDRFEMHRSIWLEGDATR